MGRRKRRRRRGDFSEECVIGHPLSLSFRSPPSLLSSPLLSPVLSQSSLLSEHLDGIAAFFFFGVITGY